MNTLFKNKSPIKSLVYLKLNLISYTLSIRTNRYYLRIIFLLTSIHFISFGFGQIKEPFPRPTEHSLYLGDHIPEEFYEQTHKTVDLKSGKTSTVTFSSHRDKLIILDFWASWCMPCLGSLKHLNAIQNGLDSSKVKVIPVAYQDIEEIKPIIERFGWRHESILNDSILGSYFPHSALPHMVWIKDGKVVAMPAANYATIENITKTINGNRPQMIQQLDVRYLDYNLSLFRNKEVRTKLKYKDEFLTIGGYIPGFASEMIRRTDTKDSVFITMVNLPLENILYDSFHSKISPYLELFSGALKIDVDSTQLEHFLSSRPKLASDADYQKDLKVLKWNEKELLTLDFRLSKSYSEKEIGDLLRASLTSFVLQEFDIFLKIEDTAPKKIPVMKAIVSEDSLKNLFQRTLSSKNRAAFIQYPSHPTAREKFNLVVSYLLGKVSDRKMDFHGITDQSEFANFDGFRFEFPRDLFERKSLSFEEVERFLNSYGMTTEFHHFKLPYLRITTIPQN